MESTSVSSSTGFDDPDLPSETSNAALVPVVLPTKYAAEGIFQAISRLPLLQINGKKIRPDGDFTPQHLTRVQRSPYRRPRHTAFRHRVLPRVVNRRWDKSTRVVEDHPRIIATVLVILMAVPISTLLVLQPWSSPNYEAMFNKTSHALDGLGPGVHETLALFLSFIYNEKDARETTTLVGVGIVFILVLLYLWQKQAQAEYGWVEGVNPSAIRVTPLTREWIQVDEHGHAFVLHAHRRWRLKEKYLPEEPVVNVDSHHSEDVPAEEEALPPFEALRQGLAVFVDELEAARHLECVAAWQPLQVYLVGLDPAARAGIEGRSTAIPQQVQQLISRLNTVPIGDVPLSIFPWHTALSSLAPESLADLVSQVGGACDAFCHQPNDRDTPLDSAAKGVAAALRDVLVWQQGIDAAAENSLFDGWDTAPLWEAAAAVPRALGNLFNFFRAEAPDAELLDEHDREHEPLIP